MRLTTKILRMFVLAGGLTLAVSVSAVRNVKGQTVCVGDCEGAQLVNVRGIIILVNIALGGTQPSTCLDGIPSGAVVNVALIIQAVNNALYGCQAATAGTPTPTATIESTGPQVVFLGVIKNFDGCVFCCDPSCVTTPTPTPAFEEGRRVYHVDSGQFVIVVEGVPGVHGIAPGTSLRPVPPSNRPDLQIESTRTLGQNPPKAPCDTSGGVPGVNPPDFGPDPSITDALNTFACRFDPSITAGSPCTFTDSSGDPKLINPGAAVQFCDFVGETSAFPPGDSIVTVKLRDTAGNLGPPNQIVIRVSTPTPTH